MSPVHVQPTTELAPRALLPGDPGRALLLAQELLERPLMFNHNRGLWGYTGTAADGAPLTIQSTGMGGPSAAIVLHELIDLGLERAVRVGTCGSIDAALGLGDLVIAEAALSGDGTSRALGAAASVPADPALTAALCDAAPDAAHVGTVLTTDLFYAEDGQTRAGAIAVEMEAAALFALASRRGVAAGCVLVVSDRDAERLPAEELAAAGIRAGRVALTALRS